MRNLTRTSPLSKFIASMKTRRKIRKPSYGDGTKHVHTAGVYHYRWHTWASSLSQATSGTPVTQERWELLDYDALDKNQSLICHSENIPPMFKGFIEERKSCVKRDGLWHWKRTLRTLDFSIQLLLQFFLLFSYYYNVEIMADFIKELVKKDHFPIFSITYFAFYLNDCIIELFFA